MTAGSKYTGKNGQASVEAYQKGDSIYITATCDSLQILVESQYREIERLRQVIDKQKEVIEKPTPLKERIAGAVMYILAGMVITFIIQFLWKIKKKTA